MDAVWIASSCCLLLGLTIAAPPIPSPQVTYVDPLSNTSVIIAWNTIDNSTGYHVFYKVHANSYAGYKSKTFAGAQPSCLGAHACNITGLKPGVMYCFKVAAYNEDGLSDGWDSNNCSLEATQGGKPTTAPWTNNKTTPIATEDTTLQSTSLPTDGSSPRPCPTQELVEPTKGKQRKYPCPTHELVEPTKGKQRKYPYPCNELVEPTKGKQRKYPCPTHELVEPTKGSELSNKQTFNWLLYVVVPMAGLIVILVISIVVLVWRLHINQR
ncbi:predicted protein [Nematostella vectensis]|uniref:Fibronectin type-III domain-containing protein n=1 Tax=Nematostella vectensis TaxID=45351 RepID=A7SNP2_NEMVE|nr:predicted protein [Nematostella vectensis]|eukprot:XP_001626790.1 predicted protein [Nematostella vectensis]